MKRIFKDKKSKKSTIAPLIEKHEILEDMSGVKGTSLLLGKYTLGEAEIVLRKKNFYKEAKKRDLWPIHSELDSSQFPLQRLIIYYKEKDPENIIVDLKIREGTFKTKKDFPLEMDKSKFLVLEWLTLQNPLTHFEGKKTPLPGQKHPGLNLGKKIVDLFKYLARLNKDKGIIAYPAYFHNALLFSRYFEFISSQKKAEVEVIKKTFNRLTFKELAWIVHLGCLRGKKGSVYKWEAEEMIHPLDKRLERYFDSKKYKKEVKHAKKKLSFSIDWECFKNKMEIKGRGET